MRARAGRDGSRTGGILRTSVVAIAYADRDEMAHKGAAHRPRYEVRDGGSGRATADKVHNIFVQAGKNRFSMEDVCPCCNPGYDGTC